MSAFALAADVVSWVLLSGGALFCVLGGLGIVRFPDFYTRVHAAGLTDTLGAGLMISGLVFQAGLSQVTIKLALVMLFLIITSPTASHALVKAAHGYDVRLDLEIPQQPLAPGEDPYTVRPASGPTTEGSTATAGDDASAS